MSHEPIAPSSRPQTRAGFAISALIMGITAFATGWVPYLGFLIGFVAVVLAVIALVRRQSSGMSITGLVLGAIAIVFCLFVTIFVSIDPIRSLSPDGGASQETPETEQVPSDPEREESEVNEKIPATSFGDGTHSVGVDIVAGTYRNDVAGDMCYYFWKDGTGADAETLDMGHVEEGGAATITVENGQAFKTNQCGTWVKQ
ncbi:DUF4190 domain-containing protein [Leucobacter chromiiresistens]